MNKLLATLVLLSLFPGASQASGITMTDAVMAPSLNEALPAMAKWCAEEIPMYEQRGYTFTGIGVQEVTLATTPKGKKLFEFQCNYKRAEKAE